MAFNFGDWAIGRPTSEANGAAKRIREFLDIGFPTGRHGVTNEDGSPSWIDTKNTRDFAEAIIRAYDAERLLTGDASAGSGGGGALPVADTTAIVKGSTDATKLVRIEADGITAATTRVISMPDKDVTLDDSGDTRPPTAHASDHTDGTDDIQSATAAQKGLATAAQITKLDAIEALADVTDATSVDAAGAVMESDFAAKGSVLAATAAGTPGSLAVGADGLVLRADSAESTGVKWAAAGGLAEERLTYPGNILSGNTIYESLHVSAGLKVTGITVSTITTPIFTSAVGTFTLAVFKGVDGSGNNMLSAATFDLEMIPAKTDTNVTLTGTPADLEFAAAGFMRVSVVSSVSDLTPAATTDALLVTIITEPI